VSVAEPVEAGSSLAMDDQAHPQMPCSQLAWWGIAVGVEHLDAATKLVDNQMAKQEPIMPAATYTVLRGSMIGSCQAVLLLGTPARRERIIYGLRIAREEYRQVKNFRQSIVEHPGLSESAREKAGQPEFSDWPAQGIDRVEALLAQYQVSDPRSRLKDSDLIEKAAALVHKGQDAELLRLAVEMEWNLGSGSAHGRLLMNMHRPGGHRIDETQQVAYFGTGVDEVATQIGNVALVLSEAWRMWDARKQA
jgi:hypothetical protein